MSLLCSMLGARAWALERALIRSQLGFSWLSGFQCEVILEGRFIVLGGEWLSVCAWGVHLSALGWLAYGFLHSADLVGYGAHVEAIFELGGLGVQGARHDSSISIHGIHLLC